MARGGSQPGERRGGRKPGTPNKRTADIAAKMAALGCDPHTAMARIGMNPKNPVEVRLRAFIELAQYIAPKRKAVEHSGDIGLIDQILLDIAQE
jgi:hypothetical protein